MDTMTQFLLATGLVIAWLIGPLIIIHYRVLVVPRRYKEIRDRFMADNPTEALAPWDDRHRSGAWHYARLLDPDVELEDGSAEEAVLSRQFWHFHGWSRYRLPLTLVVLLSALMLTFSGLWLVALLDQARPAAAGSDDAATVAGLLERIPAPFVMALWGAVVWSLYEILSRCKSGDLTPVELYDIATRYVTAIPVGYAFSLLVFDTVPSLAAFCVSAFPLRDLRQFTRTYFLNKLKAQPSTLPAAALIPSPAGPIAIQGYIADTLSGVGKETVARLEELHIETYLDLAYADPIKLLIKTGVPIELVLAWIDQALLCVYAAPLKAGLAAQGMPCALDLCEFFVRHCWDVAQNDYRPTWSTEPAVLDLAARLNLSVDSLVNQVLRSVFEDPHTRFLVRVWFGPAKSVQSI